MIWFPVLIFGLMTERTLLAIALGFAGLLFTAAARAVVWSRHCPRCGVHFGSSTGVFRLVWDQAGCLVCWLSLFSLRRENGNG